MPIYKYLAPERTQVLENATLRATQANALNDPFELKPFFNSIMERADLQAGVENRVLFEEELRKAYMKQPAEMRARVSFEKLMALSKQQGFKQQMEALLGKQIDSMVNDHLPVLTEKLRSFIHEKLGNIVGIVSFSDTSTEGLMWAHYASDHKGFIVEFNEVNGFFDCRRSPQDEFFYLRQVEYHEAPRIYEKLTELDGTKLLCAKQSRWSYELERRMLIPVDPEDHKGPGEPIHLIEFPRDSVNAVIVGERASAELVGTIRNILSSHPDYSKVRLRKAHADLRTGEMVISDLEP